MAWKRTGKRWLPLRELVNQTADPHNVITVVLYRLLLDDGGGNTLYPHWEAAQEAALTMTSADALEWTKRAGDNRYGEWTANSPEKFSFRVVSVVIEVNPLVKPHESK